MSRVHRHFVFIVGAFVLALLAAPLAQGASKYPTVSSVSPLQAGIGDTLTIKGKGFRSGKNKNTVVFRSNGGKTVFAKAGAASSTRIQIVIPAKLMPYMTPKNGTMQPTRFRIRVVANKLGKKYTPSSKSPVIGPVGTAKSASTTNASSSGDCDGDGIPNGSENDMDNDLLSNTLERSVGTDVCDPDTDSDGVSDGYEYYSALDYNSVALPYPGTRPYPNPLDGHDVNIDHDGDGLSLYEEYEAWRYTGSPFPLSYSAGTQWTGGKISVANGASTGMGFKDLDNDGTISDNEKDVDNDGLDNYSETHGPMMGPFWWTVVYGTPQNNECGAQEKAYPLSEFAGTSFVNPDADGDGLKDGADDIDHDGYSNAFEAYRPGVDNTPGIHPNEIWCSSYVSTVHTPAAGIADLGARVQPFNPCKPTYSDACHQYSAIPAGYYVNEDWESPYHGTL